jgi:hypothetical protein
MKKSESDHTVAAPAADRDALPARSHLNPTALALAVILSPLGRNPRSGRRPNEDYSQRPSRGHLEAISPIPETRGGFFPARALCGSDRGVATLNLGGLQHG